MALFKINRGSAANLPEKKTEGWMYITEDAGEIYVDLSASERIKLNAEAANKIRKLTTNTDGSSSEVSLSYDDLLAIHKGFTDSINTINTELDTKMNTTNPVGSGSLTIGGTTPQLSVGTNNAINAPYTYALGSNIEAMGNYSLGVGKNILLDSGYVYAFGDDITSEGMYSFTTGLGTQTKSDYQVVHGKYNTPDSTSLVIIGNGTNDSNRSNAYVLDSTGSGKFAGDVYVSNGSKKLATEDAVASAKTELETKIGTNTDAINTINNTTIPAAKTYAEEKATAAYNDAVEHANDLHLEHETDISNLTNTVSANKTELEGKISDNTTLINNLKYAASNTVGGNAIKANTVNITRPSSFIDAAAAVAARTEAIFFYGSDGTSGGAPVNYVIINVKKGDNGRTIADCYSLQTGAHYTNGCMNSGYDSSQTSTYNIWTGWKL